MARQTPPLVREVSGKEIGFPVSGSRALRMSSFLSFHANPANPAVLDKDAFLEGTK